MGREVNFKLILAKDDGGFSRPEVAAWPQTTGRPGESLELNRCKFARLADGAM